MHKNLKYTKESNDDIDWENFSKTINTATPFISIVGNILISLYSSQKVSLSSFTKPSIISAPVFIQDSINNEIVISGLNKNLLNLYGSLIMMAFDLDRFVTAGIPVRSSIGRVSSRESFGYIEKDKIKSLLTTNNLKITNESSSSITKPVGIRSMFATGRLLDIELNNAKNKINIKVFVQFLNRVISSSLLNNVIELSYKDKNYRFMKYRAKEISFWKDLVFGLDYVKKQKQALSKVKTDDINTIQDIIKDKRSSFIIKLVKSLINFKSTVNVHNNIWILDEAKFNNECKKLGLNPNKNVNIQKILSSMKSLVIATVNPLYQTITIYIDSINRASTYTYKEMLQASSEKNDLFEMMNIFETLKHGSNNAI